MSSPRIDPGTRRDIGWMNWIIATVVGRAGGTRPPNLFLTMARHKRLFRGWLRFAGRLMPGGKLPRRDSELVILRVAHLAESVYEFEHHARLGRKAGLTQANLDAVTWPVDNGTWTERQRTLLSAVDQLHSDRDLDDETWSGLRNHLTEREAIEFLLLVGHYEMLATFLTTLRVAPDKA
jgi:alkylhydroperoxidase family enzyme